MNSPMFIVIEFKAPRSSWVKQVHGPISAESAKALCAQLKEKYIWHTIINVDDVANSIPGAGIFREELINLVQTAIDKPILNNIKAVTRHLRGFKRNDWGDTGEEIDMLNCPTKTKNNPKGIIELPDCDHCSYHDIMISFAPSLNSLIDTFAPAYKNQGLKAVALGNAYYCKCSLHAAKVVLGDIGVSNLNATNVGPFMAMLLSLKVILDNPPIRTSESEESGDSDDKKIQS